MIGTWSESGVRCKIAFGWERAGRTGEAISYFDYACEQLWVVVKWDDEDDPDIHKAAGILIKRPGERKWHEIEI